MNGKLMSLMSNITGNKKENPYKIIHLTKKGEREPRYYLFKTKDVLEYLKFLEKLDESKYQIVDISISVQESTLSTTEFYMITYKILGK